MLFLRYHGELENSENEIPLNNTSFTVTWAVTTVSLLSAPLWDWPSLLPISEGELSSIQTIRHLGQQLMYSCNLTPAKLASYFNPYAGGG